MHVPPHLWHDLEHGDEVATCEAAKLLTQRRPPGVVPRLVRVLRTSPSAHARYFAAWALGQPTVRALRAAPALLAALDDTREAMEVRGQAAETLGLLFQGRPRVQAARVGHVLLEALEHPDPALRYWCAYALGLLAFRPALVRLRELARSDERLYGGWWTVGEEAADAIAHIEGRPVRDRVPFATRLPRSG